MAAKRTGEGATGEVNGAAAATGAAEAGVVFAVCYRSTQCPCSVLDLLCKAEIRNLDVTVLVNQQILRLCTERHETTNKTQ